MLDVIYPRNCLACGVDSPDTLQAICWDCLSTVPRVEPPFCMRCGDPVAGNVEHSYTCYSCSRKEPAFERARSAVRYEGAAGAALRALKYDRAVWAADDCASLATACVQAQYSGDSFDAVVPVPLFPPRRRMRGFNQSEEIARGISRRIGVPLRSRFLRRIRPTVTQTGLTAPQRAANVFGAFRAGVAARPAGQRILLVDDVMTTGATVDAAADALKKGGAETVYVITVARG